MRYERKFAVTDLVASEIELLVRFSPALFTESYSPRHVNNIYFDSINFSGFSDAVEGVSERLKTRIRWYGPLLGEVPLPTLELKRKKGIMGDKLQFRMDSFNVGPAFCADVTRQLFDHAKLDAALKHELRTVEATLLNRYWRKYYVSASGACRVTIDSQLEFYGIRRLCNEFERPSKLAQHVIIELKYGIGAEQEAMRIANSFPFRLTRMSKYRCGVAMTLGS
jgi:hypothetical protein